MKKLCIAALIGTFCLMITGCVQKTHVKKIYFTIDMRSAGSFEKVGVRGDIKPLSWQESILLTDEDMDSIYTTEVEVNTASNQLNFKFVIDESEFELDGKDNRVLPFEYKEEDLNYSTKFNQVESVITKK